MLFLDLDRFKEINDVEGHAAGDAALRIVGERLRHLSRSGDVIARIGGDEFVILAPTDHRQAEALAERVRASLSRPIAVGQASFVVDVSVGVATAATAAGIRRLLTAADDAMRAEKAAHRLTAAGS
jgi:diguanylate cyclase (GGDEF)-like protein